MQVCGGWGSFPHLVWHGRLKTRLRKALGNLWCFAANMQICKSPQAANELNPNLLQNKEEQLLPRVLQLPCNQDFNARTRDWGKLREEWVALTPPFSCRSGCCTWKMVWKTSWRMLHCAAAQNPGGGSCSCQSQAGSCCVPSASRAPLASAARGNRLGSGLADPSRTLGLQWMQRFPYFPW